MDVSKNRLQSFSFLGLFAIVSVLLFFVFSPFIQMLTLAAVLAILLQKPFENLTVFYRGMRSLAAATVVCFVLIFVIAPLFFLGTQIFQEAQSVYYQSPASGATYIQVFESS